MELAGYIAELLHKHNCVIVPNFGGFIANYKSAVIDSAKLRIDPPSKSVLFNPNLTNNDGLLGNKVAKEQAISYTKANDYIDGRVKDWKKELAQGNRIEIGEVGFLFRQNNQIIFEQNRAFNLLLNAYGLSGLSFVDLSVKETVEEEVVVKELIAPTSEERVIALPQTVKPLEAESVDKEAVVIALNNQQTIEHEPLVEEEKIIPISRKKNKAWKYIAVAAAIPLLFYSYWIPMETDFIDTGKIQVSDFNPIHKSPERVYKMRISAFETKVYPASTSWEQLTENLSDNVGIYNYQFDNELYIPVRLDKTATALPTSEAVQANPAEKNSTADLKYHVIGGCFSVQSNAQNFVADLISQGYSASILDHNKGLYRVSVGDFAKRSEAKSSLASFKSGGNSGWILKK